MDISRPLAVFGEGLSEKCRASLVSLGFNTLPLPRFDALGSGVASHADLMIFILDDKVFCYGDYVSKHEKIQERLIEYGYKIIRVGDTAGDEYPRDVALNCLPLGDHLLAKLDATADSILEYATACSMTPVNINQGYARCCACPVSEDAVITADPSISRAARECGIDVLDIRAGGVALEGYPYGFIGGACGTFGDKVYFAGDLSLHPDGERIADFCRAHSKDTVSLSDEPLCDVGSIFFIDKR